MDFKNIIILIVVAFIAFFIWNQFFSGERIKLPTGVESTTETIFLKDGKVLTDEDMKNEENKGTSLFSKKEITITDGTKHSVPLDEIIGGGPPKDGIPSIDDPKFISTKEASEWLPDNEPGLAFSRGKTHRFYPYQILVWHEIVNDTVGGKRILISYCPLCLTGFVFDPKVDGERVEFGTSGKLWKSNLVMYDRKTDSLWAQVLGEAIVGEKTGTKLSFLSSDQILFGNWKKEFPNGEVLSRDTGATRFYGSNPYGGFFNATEFAIQMAGSNDSRLPPDAFVFGIIINDKPKAYFVETLKKAGEITDIFEGATIVTRYDKNLDVVRIFKKLSNGELERINPFSSFWFSWSAVHPNTELFK